MTETQKKIRDVTFEDDVYVTEIMRGKQEIKGGRVIVLERKTKELSFPKCKQ